MHDPFARVHADRAWSRMHNIVGRVTLPLGDDSGQVQLHQIEGYTGELRNQMQRFGEYGFASMPLPGAKGVALYQGGHRGFPTIVATEDPRYRPKGLQPGESGLYIIDGADGNGGGGTVRWLLKGALGWFANLFGKTINVGASGDTDLIQLTGTTITIGTAADTTTLTLRSNTNINIVSSGNISLNATGALNLTGGSGDITIGGITYARP